MFKTIIALTAAVGFSSASAATKTSVATTATPAATATAVAPTGQANTVSVSAKSVAPSKKVTVNYLAENGAGMADANRQNSGAVESLQHIGVKYAFDDNRTLQYRQYFMYNSSDAAVTNEWDLGDSVFQYTDAQMANIGGTIPVLGYARVYLPVSDYSTEVGKYELRLVGAVDYQMENRFKFSALINTRFYGYTEDSSGQKGFRTIPLVELSRENTLPGITPYVAAYTDHRWNHTGSGVSPYKTVANPAANQDDFWSSVGIRTKPLKNVKLDFYVETQDNLRDGKDFVLFNEDTSVYYMDFGVTL